MHRSERNERGRSGVHANENRNCTAEQDCDGHMTRECFQRSRRRFWVIIEHHVRNIFERSSDAKRQNGASVLLCTERTDCLESLPTNRWVWPLSARERAPDPRPDRTKKALFDALLELIQEKRWDKIRVQDVLDRTGFGRSTFYAHYDNKFDLLTAGIPEVVLPITTADDDVPDMESFFEHVRDMAPVLRPIMSQSLLGEVMDLFQRQLSGAWSGHLSQLQIRDDAVYLTAEMLAASLLAVSRRWVVNKCDLPLAVIASHYESSARALIEAARNS